MNPTVIQGGMADAIAHAFYSIGYRPRESLVLVGLRGPRLRLGVTLRIDLPPTERHRLPLSGHVRALRGDGADAVIVIIVSERSSAPAGGRRGRAGPSAPHQRLVRAVRRALADAGLDVLDVLTVGEHTWRSALCRSADCCPPEGRPLADVMTSAVATWRVTRGQVLAADEEALMAFVDPVPQPVPEGVVPPDGAPSSAVMSAREALGRWRSLLDDDALRAPPDGAAVLPDVRWLAEALQDRRLRDAVLLSLLPDAGTASDDVLLRADASVMDELFEAPPDAELLARGTALLAAVARAAPPGRRADALALLAWAAWWAGEGARGRLLAARAMADQPSHTLAALVDQLLYVGVAPGWTRRRAG